MEVTDWRCISQHHISELVENAVEHHQFHIKFKPSVIIAAGDDALSVARILRATLKSKIGTGMPILTHNMDLYDEEANPYNPNLGYWGNNSFSGHHVLVVDKADNSRSTLALFLDQIKKHCEAQKSTAKKDTWIEPQVGVFVLHNKRRPKAADLPAEVLDGRYFACEECDNVAISYPFSVREHETPVHQPSAHGDQAHVVTGKRRTSFEESQARSIRVATPPPLNDTRVLSSRYVEEVIERALQDQKVFDKFKPTALLAVCDDSLAPARMIRAHEKGRTLSVGETQQPAITVLTHKLDVYDEEANPYNPIVGSWASKSLSGQRFLLVEKVVKTRRMLVQYIDSLKERISKQRAEEASDWVEPVIGLFVLHDKDGVKDGELPDDLLKEHYFVAEHVVEDVQIAYPFHVEAPIATVVQ